MSVCTSCGGGLREGALFCTSCGAKSVDKVVVESEVRRVETSGPESVNSTAPQTRARIPRILTMVAVAVGAFIVGVTLSSVGGLDWLTGDKFTTEEVKRQYDAGYESGRDDGYDAGRQDGYSSGRSAGYSDGFDAGCNSVFNKVLSDSGYSALVAWDRYFSAVRGDVYYTSTDVC